ncbi:MFS transporter [Pseudoclavibacter sp. CFCC 13796]|uniref:MFS transporter n=1 Tax=Pseudoclavibacter sp. CFCC 13796 TaxID=2615179 RepID=UPI0013017082|nr:MFS transporter [Pseudoclavibacter sp. CFCC 13796]KAB1659773.1 MFS transporter [Pseudoclavibacter sp. CFCC 13796]
MSTEPTASTTPKTAASWRDLFAAPSRAAVIVLASGIALYGTNVYLTASLLPSAVADIGGQELYAWVSTAFLLPSVVASLFVGRALAGWGARRAYLVAFLGFATGLVLSMIAPNMPMFLAGRFVQGCAGGLLTGLAYAVMRVALAPRLWTRAIALLSAMWGVGNFVGPMLGGLFAEFGIWRGAFAPLAIGALVAAGLALRTLPRTASAEQLERMPIVSLTLLTGVTAALSLTVVFTEQRQVLALLGVAAALAVAFVLVERSGSRTLLPHSVYRGGSPLRWIYIVIAALSAASTVEAFVPLFGQELAGMSPFVAGFLGAMISWGWTFGGILTSGAVSDGRVATLRVGGPMLLAVGLAGYALVQPADAGLGTVALWFAALFVAGVGIGSSFGHTAAAALRSTDDPVESQKASAGVNTVQLLANTVGSALAGLLVNLGGPTIPGSARSLTLFFAAFAAVGAVAAWLAVRQTMPGTRRETAR